MVGCLVGRRVSQKGFGKEEPGLQTKLEAFFNAYGRTNQVRMRRVDGTKEFKVRFTSRPRARVPYAQRQHPLFCPRQGSVFAEFADFKSVEAFLSADPKPTWEGAELLIMSKCVPVPPRTVTASARAVCLTSSPLPRSIVGPCALPPLLPQGGLL